MAAQYNTFVGRWLNLQQWPNPCCRHKSDLKQWSIKTHNVSSEQKWILHLCLQTYHECFPGARLCMHRTVRSFRLQGDLWRHVHVYVAVALRPQVLRPRLHKQGLCLQCGLPILCIISNSIFITYKRTLYQVDNIIGRATTSVESEECTN